MIYADTPGMHIKSPKVMNKVLNRSAESLMEDSDIILFVIQRLTLDEQDLSILKNLNKLIQRLYVLSIKLIKLQIKTNYSH